MMGVYKDSDSYKQLIIVWDMALKILVCVLVLASLIEGTTPPQVRSDHAPRTVYGKSLYQRQGCEPGELAPSARQDTTDRLQRLREEMIEANITAYIITSNDEHQSEYVADHDKRRAYISGFTGSAGHAVVTLEKAALWTDSRYYLQAETQLDCNWILMRSGYSDVPSIPEFIINELKPGDVVSSDPRIVVWRDWTSWHNEFKKVDIVMELHLQNLVDLIWGENEDRPQYPDVPLFVLDTKYAGKSWQTKLADIRKKMAENNAQVLVLSALDEIAWTLNLRGGDVPYTPVFRSYMMIGRDWATVYLPSDKVVSDIEDHLNSKGNNKGDSIEIKEYDEIWNDIENLDTGYYRIWLPDRYSYAGGVSYLLYRMTPEGKALLKTSPALLMKDYKNKVEVKGMRNAHIRDAVALCQFLSQLESEVMNNTNEEENLWDELSTVTLLDRLRKQQALSLGPSFGTIAAFGPNSALPHYAPSAATNRIIDNSSLFMVDSGGQYLDGTTDVTRTVHFGTPTERQREIYTHLLMGCIDIVSTVFPEGQTLSNLEILIRAPLYSLGLNYGHGSTHGIGSCLAVHEAFNSTYHENFFGSQEPGYYEAEHFGMRLENIVTVIKADVESQDNTTYLTFEPVTLVPYESKLINRDLMSKRQLLWLNTYHDIVREIVGSEMLRQKLKGPYEWLLRKTEPIW